MRLFGGKIGFVGSGIHSLSSQILSKSFRNWFENRTLRGTKKGEKFASLLFYLLQLLSDVFRLSGNLVGISINLCKSIQKELFINDTP